MITDAKTKATLDLAVARMVIACRVPFRAAENARSGHHCRNLISHAVMAMVACPQFLRMVAALRPGYQPPSRKQIAGNLLNQIYDMEFQRVLAMAPCMTIFCRNQWCRDAEKRPGPDGYVDDGRLDITGERAGRGHLNLFGWYLIPCRCGRPGTRLDEIISKHCWCTSPWSRHNWHASYVHVPGGTRA